MMKKKQVISLFLTCIMLTGTLAGCGSPKPSTPVASQAPQASQAPVTKTDSAKVNLNIHFHSNDKFTINDKDGKLLPVFQLAADKTNVTVKSVANPTVAKGASRTEFELQAAQKFPADIYGGNSLKKSIESYGTKGAFLSLNDLINSDAPNIKKYLDANPSIKKSITDPSGKIYMLPYVPDGRVARAYFIRTDWMKKLGFTEMPKTVDELEKILYAFKGADLNGDGKKDTIPYFNDKFEEMIRLANLWGARVYGFDSYAERVVLDKNDKFYDAWTAPAFKDALVHMAKWYKDGIIDPEVFTRKPNTARQTYLTKENRGGMTHEWVASTTNYNHNTELLKTTPDFKLEAFLPPANGTNPGFEEHVRATIKPDGWAISSSTKHAKEAIKYMDWFYTEEGRRAINYGIEGKTYDMVDGKPIFKKEIIDKGGVNVFLQTNYGGQLPIGYAQDYSYERQWTVKEGQDAVDLYTKANPYTVPITPVMAFAADEQKVYDKTINSLNTYQDEQIQGFITGKLDINKDWDAYVKKCNDLGAENLVKIYTSAYDRYKSTK